jgi:hypothetical protein
MRPFERIHDAVPKVLSVAGQMTVGDVVQMEKVIHEVAHEGAQITQSRHGGVVTINNNIGPFGRGGGPMRNYCSSRQ